MNLLMRARKIAGGIEVIADWLGGDAELVDQNLANRRALLCSSCPENKRGMKLIASVASAIKRYAEVKNRLGIATESDDRLGQCGICLCDLKLKVHEPAKLVKSHMAEGELDKFPEYCWQRKESQNA